MRSAAHGFLLLCALALSAPGASALPGEQAGAPAPVNRDSLESMTRFLAIDPGTGLPRSRFVLRTADIGRVADSLAARLARRTGGAVDRVAFSFPETIYSGGGSFTGENIVARIPGTGAGTGVMLLTAHYDAIASRTDSFRQRWETMAAPGADDDATGVAAVMELARVLPPGRYPFDILCVLFSAEELGMLGSADFASRFASLYGEEILGVVNFDMLGRPAPAGSGSRPAIVSSYLSGWLAELVGRAAASGDPPLAVRVAVPGPSNYDHGSFWAMGIPAVTVTEPLNENTNSIIYPYYHTVNDLPDALDFDLAARLANAGEAFLEGVMAPGGAELAILPADLMLMRGPFVTGNRDFETGESLGVYVRVRNVGCAEAAPGARVRLTVAIESASGTRTLFSDEIAAPGPLASTDVIRRVALDRSFAGGNVAGARLEVAGIADDPANDAAEVAFGVAAGADLVLSHGFRPNPVDVAFSASTFCVNLAREADLEIDVLTIEGERVATGRAGYRFGGSTLPAGLDCLSSAALFPAARRLASGVYLYRMRLLEPSGAVTRVTGRFAVSR